MKHLIEGIFLISLFVILYHHIGYIILLNYFSARKSDPEPYPAKILNKFLFVIPMYNEAGFIEKKIENLAAINYPSDHYQIILLDDGSTDKTAQIARSAIHKHPNLSIQIKTFSQNQGKVALFNFIIPTISDDYILFFSDVSAMLSVDVLYRANTYFNNPKVGAFCTKYTLKDISLKGEQRYWDYQVAIKVKESRLGTPIGYHGSGYAIRKSLWEPLADNTINDDFIIPMKVIEKGYLGVYDEKSLSTELEFSSEHLDWNRRVRIAQGNIQQAYVLRKILAPRNGYVSWMFFSGKVLRITMPWFFLGLFFSSLILSFYSPHIFLPIFLAQLIMYLLVLFNSVFKLKQIHVLHYFFKGQSSILMGWVSLVTHRDRWQRAKSIPKSNYVHPFVRCGKGIIDKLSALVGLSILILLFPIIAVLIKLNSPGAIFYKQLRVGKGDEKLTKLFYLYKFRTMNVCSDPSDTTWTMVGDKRIFSFGKFLRKTHLDELPQFYNILIGDMSLIGPRPERPSLYSYIEKNIPFYEERLYGVLPGLTGLAQITYPPDLTIEDVRKKVACDHAYAIHLTKPLLWIKVETIIVLKTIQNVLLGKGQ